MGRPETNASGGTAHGAAYVGLETIADYCSGRLSRERRVEFERHFAGCDTCRTRVFAAELALETAVSLSNRPKGAQSLAVELLLERLRLTHEAQWAKRNEWQPERAQLVRENPAQIRSQRVAFAARVAAMSKSKRKAASEETGSNAVDAVYGLWRNGDVKGARAMAARELAAAADREALERVLRDTSPDPRALQVSVFCLTVVAIVVLLTKFFG